MIYTATELELLKASAERLRDIAMGFTAKDSLGSLSPELRAKISLWGETSRSLFLEIEKEITRLQLTRLQRGMKPHTDVLSQEGAFLPYSSRYGGV